MDPTRQRLAIFLISENLTLQQDCRNLPLLRLFTLRPQPLLAPLIPHPYRSLLSSLLLPHCFSTSLSQLGSRCSGVGMGAVPLTRSLPAVHEIQVGGSPS